MTVSQRNGGNGDPAADEADGRRRRSAQSREAIVSAMFDLIGEGDQRPSAQRVADRAGVGIRTVFRHFDEMDRLYAEMNARLRAMIRPLLADEEPSGAAVTVTGADGFQHEGALPLVVGGLPAGNYRIKASKSHYETARSTVTLAEGESQVVDLRLQAKLMSAQMSGGDLTVQGAVDRDGVERTVRSDLSQLKYCYARRLDDDPTLAGSVTIEWGIAADGSVSTARAARSTLGDRSVESCLCDRITRMRFPAPAGGTASAGYTFSFKAI